MARSTGARARADDNRTGNDRLLTVRLNRKIGAHPNSADATHTQAREIPDMSADIVRFGLNRSARHSLSLKRVTAGPRNPSAFNTSALRAFESAIVVRDIEAFASTHSACESIFR